MRKSLVCLFVAFVVLGLSSSAGAECNSKLAVEVLGSGGPDFPLLARPALVVEDNDALGRAGHVRHNEADAGINDARASAGYVLWIDGQARLLIDAGGGVFLRFGEAKARFESLDAIAITHLHADHVADLIALLKSGFFSDRKAPLPLIGPASGHGFPGMSEFMRTQLDPDRGAYRYMSGYLDGSGGFVKLDISEIATQPSKPVTAFQNDRFKLTAIGVVHGSVPALGYIVDVEGRKLAFSGDQNGSNPEFAAATSHADLLFMDHSVPEMTGDVEASLHARPSEIAKLATDADVRKLVLSHNMSRSLSHLEENLAIIRKTFHGGIAVARDLMCFELGRR